MYVTPCIGICQIQNNICIGCKRSKKEIQNWNLYSYEERMEVMRRLGYGKRRINKTANSQILKGDEDGNQITG